MPVRSANPSGPSPRRRGRRRAAAAQPAASLAGADPTEPFRVASRDRFTPRQREGAPDDAPRVSFEVILALAIVVACACGALAVGAAFTVQV